MNRLLTLALLALSPLALSACAAIRPLEKPTVTVRDADLHLNGGSLEGIIDFDVTNPNDVSIPLRSATYTVEIQGITLGKGVTDLAETIPARGSAPVRTTLAVASEANIAAGAIAFASGARSYRVTGRLRFKTSLGDLDVEFVKEGEL